MRNKIGIKDPHKFAFGSFETLFQGTRLETGAIFAVNILNIEATYRLYNIIVDLFQIQNIPVRLYIFDVNDVMLYRIYDKAYCIFSAGFL